MPLEFVNRKRAYNRFGNMARQRDGDPFVVLLRGAQGNVSTVEFDSLVEAVYFVDEAADIGAMVNGTIELVWNGNVIATFNVTDF